jgi:hypothetical protein
MPVKTQLGVGAVKLLAVVARSPRGPGVVAVAIVGVLALTALRAFQVRAPSTAVVSSPATSSPGAGNSRSPDASSMSPAALETPPAPSPTPILGELVQGLPSNVNGQPVLDLPNAVNALVASTTDHSVLVGGWFQSTAPTWFCPAFGFDPPWGPCLRFAVHETATGSMVTDPDDPMWLYGKAPNATILLYPGSLLTESIGPYASRRPVVLSVHTHDANCTAGLKILGQPCSLQPVVDAVLWTGPSG